jgi:hypothetical protein
VIRLLEVTPTTRGEERCVSVVLECSLSDLATLVDVGAVEPLDASAQRQLDHAVDELAAPRRVG